MNVTYPCRRCSHIMICKYKEYPKKFLNVLNEIDDGGVISINLHCKYENIEQTIKEPVIREGLENPSIMISESQKKQNELKIMN